MVRLYLSITLLGFSLTALFATPALADDFPAEYDIFVKDNALTIWTDLSDLVGTTEIEDLHDGIDLLFDCKFRLLAPRRFFGDRLVASAAFSLRISQRPLTEDFVLIDDLTGDSLGPPLVKTSQLLSYLRDSLFTRVMALDSLDRDRRYRPEFRLDVISLTLLNLTDREQSAQGRGESPVRFLFRKFLDISGYGRRGFQTKTRSFRLGELTAVR